jgi:transcriptional regulator with XRE-family HTH domain
VSNIGETLRAARDARGLSREALSLRCHVLGRPIHANSIYRLETGKHGGTGIDIVESIANALGLSVVIQAKGRKR